MSFPVGQVGDITVFFQHYKTFEQAKNAWERRKRRTVPDKCVFVFIENFTDIYIKALREFDEWNMVPERKLVICDRSDVPVYHCMKTVIKTQAGVHFMEQKNICCKYYQNGFGYLRFLNSITKKHGG